MNPQTPPCRSLLDHLQAIEDPRMESKCEHTLVDIMMITLCAVICGAEDWNAIEAFGKARQTWLESFLELPNGIPSHDTFNRFFSILSPKVFQTFFLDWVRDVAKQVEEVVAIDGKTLRRSYDRKQNKKAIHRVSAWSSANQVVLGQVKTDEKSNEITAIPELLKVLNLKGCIVTLDAMGCQKKIAKQIIEAEGDYVLALKGNQSALSEQVETIFKRADQVGYEGYEVEYVEHTETHGNRTETRRHWTLPIQDTDLDESEWAGLSMIAMVERERTLSGASPRIEHRYYIGSIRRDAARLAHAVRSHWGIENQVHWQLDVSFGEDQSRMRKGHSAENFSVVRHIALNILRQDQTTRLGLKNRRLKAGWDERYLANILNKL